MCVGFGADRLVGAAAGGDHIVAGLQLIANEAAGVVPVKRGHVLGRHVGLPRLEQAGFGIAALYNSALGDGNYPAAFRTNTLFHRSAKE